jgi:hypothetical protein
MTPHEIELALDSIFDNMLDHVSEIQAHASQIEIHGKPEPYKLYMHACKIEYCICMWRELRTLK